MRHFVVYHNPDKMGYPATQNQSLDAYSDKRVLDIVGHHIWVIGPDDNHPRSQYYVGAAFVCDRTGPGLHGFNVGMHGSIGMTFSDQFEIGGLIWFHELQDAIGKGQFGLMEIRNNIIQLLRAEAALHGYNAP